MATTTPQSLARDVVLQHTFAFPEDMGSVEVALQRRLAVVDSSLVTAVFQRLEFEIAEAIKNGMDAERDRVLYTVRDIAGLEIALKVQDATVPPWASQAQQD